MTKTHRLLSILCLAAWIMPALGCHSVALVMGLTTDALTIGWLKSPEDVWIEDLYDASMQTLRDEYAETQVKEKDPFRAIIHARDGNDKKVQVKLHRLSDDRTEIRIRIGFWGDEDLSRTLLEAIRLRYPPGEG